MNNLSKILILLLLFCVGSLSAQLSMKSMAGYKPVIINLNDITKLTNTMSIQDREIEFLSWQNENYKDMICTLYPTKQHHTEWFCGGIVLGVVTTIALFFILK